MLINNDPKMATLRSVQLFAGLSGGDYELLGRLLDEVEVDAGEVLMRQGQSGWEFFVIERGSAEVTRDGETLAELEEGAVFGEMALAKLEQRNASVSALTEMRLLVGGKQSFNSLMNAIPEVADKIRAEMDQRTLGLDE